jgi:RimJ/RimL family protein N-acetyltransferase
MNIDDALNGSKVFETARLIGRRWLRSDLDTIFEVYSDPEVARYIDDGSPITREQSSAWLDVTARNYRDRGYGMFALEDRNSRDIVGFIGLVHPGGQVDTEIKYAFRKTNWGRGLASEVVQALVQYARETHQLSVLVATVAPENLASQRVLLKAGFSFIEQRTDEHGDAELYYEWRA